MRIGSSTDQTMRSITIGARAQLTGTHRRAGCRRDEPQPRRASADARAYCPIFCIATAFADAYIDLYSRTLVQVLDDTLGTTTITGIEGVDLKARHVDTVAGDGTSLNINRYGFSEAVAIIPPQARTGAAPTR